MFSDENALSVNSFLNRLKSLQKLCTNRRRPEDPSAMLVIPGLDGRSNKESVTLLKYLFGGIVGRELLNNSGIDDALEEMVLLIQETSVSVIYTSSAKKICGSMLSACPFLIEYMPLLDEEEEIDLLQARKVSDFKRMMLECVPPGSTIGMSIPIGYDSVLDVESWPLLQSFALDTVICPTGFFTSRYTVADMSEMLSITYRTVDEYSVDNAIAVLRKSILPHIMQTIAILDGPTGSQRALVVASDAIGPLEMLYEFGEMECMSLSEASGSGLGSGTIVSPLDPAHRPVLLFGLHSSAVGAAGGRYPKGWQDTTAGDSLHVVVEGCEPSTGIRFCRCYFLRRGKSLPYLKDAEALVGGDDDEVDEENRPFDDEKMNRISPIKLSQSPVVVEKEGVAVATLERLEGLYVKLWLGLRATVQSAFQTHVDVLEAGTYVQRTMDALMKGKLENVEGIAAIAAQVDLPGLSGLRLRAGERLQVHMDCMNAFGEVVSVEDVDDMGGSCWCYIRVSIHGIATGSAVDGGKENGLAVAVGDTFLFSVGKKLIADQQNKSSAVALDGPKSTLVSPPSLLLADNTCLTHAVPYYRCLLGQGDEDKSAQRFLACTRSPHMLHALGLGDPIDLSSSGINRGFNAGSIRSGGGSAALLSSVPTLTDHPILPVLASDIRLFSAGLVIERTHTASLPIMICMEQHVAEMWTVDASECLSLAQSMGLIRSNGDNETLPEPSVPDGLLVILRLKQFDESNQPSVETHHNIRSVEASQAAAAAQEGKENRRTNYEEKNRDDDEDENDDDDEDTYHRKPTQPLVDEVTITSMRTAMMFNPLKRALSNLCTDDHTGSQCIALFAPMGTRISAAISTALISWRAALRSQDIPEHRGQGVKRATTTSSSSTTTATGSSPNRGMESVEGSVPMGILRAFVMALDTWSIAPADTSGPGATWGLGGESRPTSTAQISMDDLLYEENIPVSSATLLAAAKQSTQDGVPASGFLAMRSVHAYSEAIRLYLPNGGVQTYNMTSNDDKQSGMDNTVQLVIVTGQAGSGVGVLARHIRTRLEESSSSSLGTVGSVTVDLAAATADVAEVLGEHDSDEAKASDDQRVSRACREAITTAFRERMKGRNVPLVVVVSVTLASRFHMCQSDLLFLLHHAAITSSTSTKINVSIAIRVAVVSATAAANAVLVTPCDGHLVGVETWRSTGLEICHRGLCDVAIVIDATSSTAGDAYYSFRNWLQRINPDAQVVRQHPGSLRLDEEAMDMLSSFLETTHVGSGNKHGTGTGTSTVLKEIRTARNQAHATFAIRYDPLGQGSVMSSSAGKSTVAATLLLPKARFSCRPSVPGEPAGLSAFRVIPPSLQHQQHQQSNNNQSKNSQSTGTGLWSVPALLHVMQFIFPQASVSCPAAYASEDHWNVPPPTASVNGTPQYGFRRAIELARAKVFSTRRFAAEKQAIVYVLNEVRKQAIAVDTLRMGMLSVHGTLLVRSMAHTSSTRNDSAVASSPSTMSNIWVTFEAHAGAIIVREASIVDENTNSTCPLIIQGSFTSASEAMLRRLVLVCEQRPLLRKTPVTRDSLTSQDILNAQIKYCGLNNQKLALPGGWWFDGNVYLDVNGNKRPYRPDIDDILVDYMIEKNKIVDQFNQHIHDLQPYL